MIILDVIDAALREATRERRERGRIKPLRLQGRAGEGTPPGSDARPELGEALSRPAEGLEHPGRQDGIVQDDVVEKRRIAEQHVHELAGVVSRGLRIEPDARLENSGPEIANGAHLAHDLAEHALILDGRDRHLDALLDRDGAGAFLDGAGLATDVVDGLDRGFHDPIKRAGRVFSTTSVHNKLPMARSPRSS